jgi:hypothetical protein
MITYILALVSALSLFPRHAISEVNFKTQTIKATLAQAKSEQKLVFSVCSSKECRPCRWMEDNVYKDTILSKTINDKLIPIKPNASMDRLEWLVNCQGGVPTMNFLDENGKIVHTVSGRKTLEEMSEIVKQVLSTNCTAKDEKLDEISGTKKRSVCCDGLVKKVNDEGSVCVEQKCIDDSISGVPLKGHLRDSPPCCDDSAEKEVTLGIGPARVRCVEQRIFKKINQGSRASKKPNFLPDSKKEKSGSAAEPY